MFLDIIPNDMVDEVAIQLKIVLDHVFLAVITQSFFPDIVVWNHLVMRGLIQLLVIGFQAR